MSHLQQSSKETLRERMVRASIKCDICPKKLTTVKQLEKHKEKEHAKRACEEEDDDEVMIVDNEEEPVQSSLGRPSVGRLLTISNENLPEEKASAPEELSIEKKSENKDKVKEPGEEEEDDIMVVKADIYKFQGKISSYEEELENNIFSFKADDDHVDDVFIVDKGESDDDGAKVDDMEEDSGKSKEEEIVLCKCDYCDQKFLHETNLNDHITRAHPPTATQVKQFSNGCFFIMSG